MSEKKLCRSVFAVRREWDKDATRDETFKHFGYENVHAPKHGRVIPGIRYPTAL